ncbi:hypothetical protein EDC01DRAFT_675583 [Geopyxis carbonaria]|nr:hypothetical protein EDC01DRAFT_675583 [Geopyxis carbonaria]
MSLRLHLSKFLLDGILLDGILLHGIATCADVVQSVGCHKQQCSDSGVDRARAPRVCNLSYPLLAHVTVHH